MKILDVQGIDVFYGQLQILFGLSFSVEDKEIVSLIGSNGTGKTTAMKAISGILAPAKGTIEFVARRIEGQDSHFIATLGLVQIPEGRQLFPTLTVKENLELGAVTKEAKARIAESFKMVYSLFPIMEERSGQMAQTLSGGEQQMVAIGRGLMARPRMLMLDEPSMGLSPLLVKEIFKTIKKINSEGTTIFLVEQNVAQSLMISNRVYVLETGHIIFQGLGEELMNNDHVRKAYLGI